MNPPDGISKTELRRGLRARVAALSPSQRAEASARARERLRAQAVWKEARAVLFYAPMPAELDLSSLIDEALALGKTVALPRFLVETNSYGACQIHSLERDCAPGKFGLSEPAAHCPPIPLKHLDFALVPGLGFDVSGHRLGRGQGFYDRLLAGISGAKCGVALDFQVVGAVPAEAHDVHMNFVLTPTRWLVILT